MLGDKSAAGFSEPPAQLGICLEATDLPDELRRRVGGQEVFPFDKAKPFHGHIR